MDAGSGVRRYRAPRLGLSFRLSPVPAGGACQAGTRPACCQGAAAGFLPLAEPGAAQTELPAPAEQKWGCRARAAAAPLPTAAGVCSSTSPCQTRIYIPSFISFVLALAHLHSPCSCLGTQSGPLSSANSSKNKTTRYTAGSCNSSLVEVFNGCTNLKIAKLSADFKLSQWVNKHLEKRYTTLHRLVTLTFPVATSNIAMELVRQGSRGAGCGARRPVHRLGIPGLQPAAVKPSMVLQL